MKIVPLARMPIKLQEFVELARRLSITAQNAMWRTTFSYAILAQEASTQDPLLTRKHASTVNQPSFGTLLQAQLLVLSATLDFQTAMNAH